MKNIIALVAATLLLAACASSGNRIIKDETSETIATKIVEGQTTMASVRATFGEPFRTTYTDGGLEVWTYQFDDVSADAVNFVPVVNLFTSSYSGTRKEVVILFDENDVVKKYKLSESDVKTKGGIGS